jgi:hypothetical protein
LRRLDDGNPARSWAIWSAGPYSRRTTNLGCSH